MTYKISTETELDPHRLAAFWQEHGTFSSFNGIEHVAIRYGFFTNPTHNKAVVVCTGRIECMLKYQELVFDFYHNGFDVYIFDHRGQGFSGRMADNSEVGYVHSFDDYCNDLAHFYQHVVNPNAPQERYLLCHSMGAAIGLSFIRKHPKSFQAVALSAPMFGFNRKGLPTGLLRALARFWRALNYTISKQPWFFLGQSGYQAIAFERNHLTHCRRRYDFFRQIYQRYPEIKLGGVSADWLLAAMDCLRKLKSELQQIKVPVLLLQAEKDTVVDNHAQIEFFRALQLSSPQSQLQQFSDAKHELLIERDPIRQSALTQIMDFFHAFPAEKSTELLDE